MARFRTKIIFPLCKYALAYNNVDAAAVNSKVVGLAPVFYLIRVPLKRFQVPREQTLTNRRKLAP
jgi:hypothetical protein